MLCHKVTEESPRQPAELSEFSCAVLHAFSFCLQLFIIVHVFLQQYGASFSVAFCSAALVLELEGSKGTKGAESKNQYRCEEHHFTSDKCIYQVKGNPA